MFLNVPISGRPRCGGDDVMPQVYSALIYSKMHYEGSVYDSASKWRLHVLHPVHSTGVFLVSGALNVSRLETLYAESWEIPLSSLTNLQFTNRKCTCWTSGPLDVLLHLPCMSFPDMFHDRLSRISPWHIERPTNNIRLGQYLRGVTCALTYRRYFAELLSAYQNYSALFTDGSSFRLGMPSSMTTK
jgi:hypothetical protein